MEEGLERYRSVGVAAIGCFGFFVGEGMRKYGLGSSSLSSLLGSHRSNFLGIETSSSMVVVNTQNKKGRCNNSSSDQTISQKDDADGWVEHTPYTSDESQAINATRKEVDTTQKALSKHQYRLGEMKQHQAIQRKSDPNPSSKVLPQKAEYMSWRLKRNRKRLARFQRAAQVIQNALRVFMAKTMIHRLTKQTSALMIQRCMRLSKGKVIFFEMGPIIVKVGHSSLG